MPDSLTISKFFELIKSEIPLLDVRAPIEFDRGAIPGAKNLPLLNNDQRKTVGICYRKLGKAAAINLGYKLISGDIKESRIKSWITFFKENPAGKIYCFRGGLRSKITQEWLALEGSDIPIIEGGYKALRHYCIEALKQVSLQNKFIVIGGKTGTSKTELINELNRAIDLEGIANHRGSAFGRRISSQPTQVNFENQIALNLIKLDCPSTLSIFIEDESSSIGSLSLPKHVFSRIKISPIALIEAPFEKRVEKILNDYIISNYNEIHSYDPKNSITLFSDFLFSSLQRIKRRLGEKNYHKIRKHMKNITAPPNTLEAMESHREWIYTLLSEYYDPMYEYQLKNKESRIIFRGGSAEFLQWSTRIDKNI